MAKSARARSTCAAGALSERLRRVNSWRSSAVSGRRGSFWWRDMAHLADEDNRTTIPVPTADDPLAPVPRFLYGSHGQVWGVAMTDDDTVGGTFDSMADVFSQGETADDA